MVGSNSVARSYLAFNKSKMEQTKIALNISLFSQLMFAPNLTVRNIGIYYFLPTFPIQLPQLGKNFISMS